MTQFKEHIQNVFSIKEAVIMKRTPMMQNQAVEILSEKLDKGLNELRIYEGINLFVEEKEEPHPEKKDLKTTKWEVEFELELNRYQIKYNQLD